LIQIENRFEIVFGDPGRGSQIIGKITFFPYPIAAPGFLRLKKYCKSFGNSMANNLLDCLIFKARIFAESEKLCRRRFVKGR